MLSRDGSNFFSRSRPCPRLAISQTLDSAVDNLLFDRFGKTGDVDQSSDVHGELQKDRKKDVEVEDVSERSFPGQFLHRLGARDAQEAHAHEHTSDSHLIVTKFDAVEVLNGERIRGDQTVEREDLVHLDRGDQCTSPLSDDVRD